MSFRYKIKKNILSYRTQRAPIADHPLCGPDMVVEFLLRNFVNLWSDGPRVFVEKRIQTAVPGHFLYPIMLWQTPVQLEYFRLRTYGYSPAAILKQADTDIVRAYLFHPGADRPRKSLVPNRYVSSEIMVDLLHVLSEQFSVSGRVPEALVSDEVMNHLMQDDILLLFLRQVEHDAYPHQKIGISGHLSEQVSLSLVLDLPQKGSCLCKLHRYWRQTRREYKCVELPYLLLHIFNGWYHVLF